MHVPPIIPEEPKKLPPKPTVTLIGKVGQAIGYAWKTIKNLPSSVYALIVKISHAVRDIFRSSPKTTSPQLNPPKVTVGEPTSPAAALFKRDILGPEDDEEGWNLEELFKSPHDERNDAISTTEKRAAQPKEQGSERDPLTSMGAVQVDMRLPDDTSLFGLEKQKQGLVDERVDQELSGIANELVKPANMLLKQLKQNKPATLDGFNAITRQLDQQYQLLERYTSEAKKMPRDVQKLFQATKSEIEEQMAELGDEVLKPSEATLEDMEGKEPAELQDFLQLSRQLDDAMEPLKVFASRFKASAPGVHIRVQGMIQALEEKKTQLDAAMCEQVRLNFKPNSAIPGIGNCMFESVRHQLGNKQGQKYYRQQAVRYMREHIEEFREACMDHMGSQQAQASIKRYAMAVAGKELKDKTLKEHLAAWASQLEVKLNREPEAIDFYLDCMENHALWGGTNELIALSEVLKVPIIVFTRNDAKTWRFDFMAGQLKYSDKPPLLIYYNGNDHYQDLIPR